LRRYLRIADGAIIAHRRPAIRAEFARTAVPETRLVFNQALWRTGIDHETYARMGGTWMFCHKRSEPLMSVPFEAG
jgi:hypothetical protein